MLSISARHFQIIAQNSPGTRFTLHCSTSDIVALLAMAVCLATSAGLSIRLIRRACSGVSVSVTGT
ncbi:hypothetical protein DD600_15090 [Enterobacter cloacae]|nr:hypothetical protein DD601_03370 [Enterobacter cloacae]RXX64919.1 hypothetical protein DD600_15090 [Enterobacter cloacae]